MTPLPNVMNVNWYITCSSCKHHQFIDVEWFKATRAKHGKDKPLTWDRLVCAKCKSRKISLSRSLPETKQQCTRRLEEEAEREAQSDFLSSVAKWSGEDYTYDDDPFVDDTGWHLPLEVDDNKVPMDDIYEAP